MNIAPHILANGNWISMASFMELALYDEDEGYYSKNIPGIGFRGDFSTAATMSSLPARCIVNLWRKSCKEAGTRLPIIEIGGGNGDMAMAIRREFSLWEKMFTKYIMVDRSNALRNLQGMVAGTAVSVYSSMEKALKRVGGKAFIFSNELPDAFPARQFVFQGGEWLELGLAVIDGHVIRQADKQPLPASTAFNFWAKEGQVIEVHESYAKWFAEWQKHWKSGVMLTIDYGQTVEKLYYRRPAGSLRGYKAHTLLSADELAPLAGRCDITADVNFTDLINMAKGCHDDIVHYMSQRDFMAPLADMDKPEDRHLIAEGGAGEYFNVMVHHRFQL